MKKERVIKISLTENIRALLEGAEKELHSRGVKDVGVSQLVERVLSGITEKDLAQFIEDLTPIEYRLKSALLDERKRRQILRILNSKGGTDAELNQDSPSAQL